MTITKTELMRLFQDETLGLNSTARMVLMAYANNMQHIEEAQEAWPGIRTVAIFAGINKDTASSYIKALEADGWLVQGGKHREGKFHYTQGYYLGAGRVEDALLKRREAHNKGNTQQATPTEAATPTGAATPTQATSHSDTSGKPLRQKQLATPTVSDRTTIETTKRTVKRTVTPAGAVVNPSELKEESTEDEVDPSLTSQDETDSLKEEHDAGPSLNEEGVPVEAVEKTPGDFPKGIAGNPLAEADFLSGLARGVKRDILTLSIRHKIKRGDYRVPVGV